MRPTRYQLRYRRSGVQVKFNHLQHSARRDIPPWQGPCETSGAPPSEQRRGPVLYELHALMKNHGSDPNATFR